MFDKNSRYKNSKIYQVPGADGNLVNVVSVPCKPNEKPLGIHKLQQGQRLDHLASKYLNDPAGFWRICEINDVMLPEVLSEANEIIIPTKTK
jgi:hypothetical protein